MFGQKWLTQGVLRTITNLSVFGVSFVVVFHTDWDEACGGRDHVFKGLIAAYRKHVFVPFCDELEKSKRYVAFHAKRWRDSA